MTDERLTDELACQVMGWKLAPGRYLKPGRAWLPKWRFSPLSRLDDAFQLLDNVSDRFSLVSDQSRTFTAEVRVNSRKGRASGTARARVITLAVARALGLEMEA